jgi:chromosome segregation ATPase
VARTDERSGSKTSRVSELEAQVASLTERATAAETALANLHKAYRKALEELQILHRRLHVAKSEHADGVADQLAFDARCSRRYDAALCRYVSLSGNDYVVWILKKGGGWQ